MAKGVPAVIPTRYLIATLFIAGLLLLLAIVQASRGSRTGPVASVAEVPLAMALSDFDVLAEFALEDGWSPRFQGTQDPDQSEPWPFEGGFGAPWEPASPYLADQGLALNGPNGRSMVVLWRGLEWRCYRFDAPLVSARLHPHKGQSLLITLQTGRERYETRLLEVPEGRVLWATDSGPWSRFSWDGEAVLVGEPVKEPSGAYLLSVLPLQAEGGESRLAQWERRDLGLPALRRERASVESLFDTGRDYRGALLLVPASPDLRIHFARGDRLWLNAAGRWSCWSRERNAWSLLSEGAGVLIAQPPNGMGRVAPGAEGGAERHRSWADRCEWEALGPAEDAWPAPDPAWTWRDPENAITGWDLRRGPAWTEWPPERQRTALLRAFRPEWRSAGALRASVSGWLPEGPEVALREASESAWVWVGTRVLLVRLQPSERPRRVRDLLRVR